MLTFLGAVVRVLVGFIAACLAAGFVQVLFAVTPAELVAAGEERLGEAATWGLLSATQIAVFAAPFALLAALISEWQGIRSFAFHAIVAMAIAVAGFGLIHATESPAEASIVNSYAMAAYLTSGFVGGLIYWLFAGRSALRNSQAHVRMESDRRSSARDTRVDKDEAQPNDQRTENERMAAHRSTGTVPVTKPTQPVTANPSGSPKPGGSSSA
ncbi:MAG: hypothetical protein ACI89J_001025 [Hyphomicrobiaceae bacterium]|jgi:hypothetical protein